MSAAEAKVTQLNHDETQVKINLDGKTFEISVEEFKDFFTRCNNILGICSIDDFEETISGISELVIEGIDDRKAASELKRPLKFLNELQYFFKSVMIEVDSEV